MPIGIVQLAFLFWSYQLRTIIFLNGLCVPRALSKTRLIWNDPFWKGYNRIYLTSKIPTSDSMAEREIERLSELTRRFDKPIVAGQSLGAWWASHVACNPNSNIDKLVLWTPMGDHRPFPIFPVSSQLHTTYRAPNPQNYGFNKVLVMASQYDWIVPPNTHAHPLADHFDAVTYRLKGDHFFQTNHKDGLDYMKDWIEWDSK
jgi:hypothetical protein